MNNKSFYLLILLNFTYLHTQTPRVILCTYYTPSHKQMAQEWLITSIQDDFEIIIGTGKQQCSSATYLQNGWTKTTREKVKFIIKTIKENINSIVIFADADIMFLKPIKKEIINLLFNKDFVGQIDRPGKLCSGFVAMWANNKTLALWKAVLEYMQAHHEISDQDALAHFLRPNKNIFNLAWDFLPTTYFGGGTFKKRGWKPGKNLIIPENPAMFHANYTKHCYKIAMLTYVKKVIKKRQKKEQT